MATLTEPQKAFIVTQLACFASPTEVVELVKEELGITVTKQQVQLYDPNTVSGTTLSEKWRKLFTETRERFKSEIENIPIANRAYRLRRLQRLIDRTQNPGLVAEFLEQAAKEVGGAFTNKRELSGPGGAAIQVQTGPDLSKLPAKDLDELERILAAADAGGGASGEGAP